MEAQKFGRTVRHWRERVKPTAIGVPVGGRRRATGLRREELAGLAGNGVRASFLDPAAKDALLAEIAAVPLP